MRKFILCLMLLGAVLVCDPTKNGAYYVIDGLPAGMDGSNIAPDPSGQYGLLFDVSAFPENTSASITVKACNAWGDCDSPIPFVLDRSAPGGIQGTRLLRK